MAEVVVSSVVELLISTVKQLIQNEVKLVRGVDKELLDLSDKLNKVRNKLYDADMKQFKERTVKDWLRRLEQKSHEMEDVLEEWNYAIIQHNKMVSGSESAPPPTHTVCSFIPSSCFCFKKLVFRHDIAKKVQNLKSELDEILNEKDVDNFVTSQPRSDYSHATWRVQTTSLIDSTEIQGRQDDMDILVKKLTAHEGSVHQVVSIVGAGGLGKTTLAQLIYNDSRVERFFDFKIWICVSDPFDVAVIAKDIIKVINKQSSLDTTQLDDLLQDLIGCISRKKILLVLDDVWNEQRDKWEPLKNALKGSGAGSRILVTTRKEQVARIMGSVEKDIHRPELLPDEDCLLLLMRMSGRSEEKFEKFHDIGKEIAEKCNGLPLAVKTLGSVLFFKKTIQEWEKVLKSEMWELEHVEVGLFPHLLLSYHELSPTLKRCFSFCAFFPKDTKLKVEKLIRIWIALGYLGPTTGRAGEDVELKGQEVFEDLAMRSLFQNFEKDELTEQINSFKMHDIVHDFAQFLRKDGRAEDPRMINRTCQVCDPCCVSKVQEYRSLDWEKESPLNLCDCLVSVRVFKYWGEVSPQSMKKLIHLKWLDMGGTTLSKEDLETICQLYFLQTLSLEMCSLKEIPREIENLVHLRYIDLSENEELEEVSKSLCSLLELETLLLKNCSLKEIPTEIGNLIRLKHLDLIENKQLEELPHSICSLVKLQTLLLASCTSLKEIPTEIGDLVNLRVLNLRRNTELKELPVSICSIVGLQMLDIEGCENLRGLPEGLGHLSGLGSLNHFFVGSDCNKFGLLKNLNNLRELSITINSCSSDMEELVKDAGEAELRNKIHLQKLELEFIHERNEEECSSSSSLWWLDVIEALEPNHNLQRLVISFYKGSKLPHWISSPLNLVREIELYGCSELVSLPAMGKLPFLESLLIFEMAELVVVGMEWLGIRERDGKTVMNTPSSPSLVAFPKLKELTFYECHNWVEWEDITAEEEESAVVSVMPCLIEMNIMYCDGLKMLPHRLLRKASSLQGLYIRDSSKLKECYRDQDGSPRRSISQNNPTLVLHLL